MHAISNGKNDIRDGISFPEVKLNNVLSNGAKYTTDNVNISVQDEKGETPDSGNKVIKNLLNNESANQVLKNVVNDISKEGMRRFVPIPLILLLIPAPVSFSSCPCRHRKTGKRGFCPSGQLDTCEAASLWQLRI